MGRKKIEKRHVRALQKTGKGSSYAVTIPIDIIRKREWQEGQNLVIKEEGDKLVVRDWEED